VKNPVFYDFKNKPCFLRKLSDFYRKLSSFYREKHRFLPFFTVFKISFYGRNRFFPFMVETAASKRSSVDSIEISLRNEGVKNEVFYGKTQKVYGKKG
jgi:hypothetical protein